MVTITFSWTDEADQSLGLPAYETAGAAGADLRANFAPADRNGITLESGRRASVPTGSQRDIHMD